MEMQTVPVPVFYIYHMIGLYKWTPTVYINLQYSNFSFGFKICSYKKGILTYCYNALHMQVFDRAVKILRLEFKFI